MQLHQVRIVNFRSIKKLTISFDPRCRILVGINESGKTNILKALQLISNDFVSTDSDVRHPLKEEPFDEKAAVTFSFRLTSDEQEKLFSNVSRKFLMKNIDQPICEIGGTSLTLRDYARRHNEAIRWEDLRTHQKIQTGWDKTPGVKILPGWRTLKNDASSAMLTAASFDGKNRSLHEYRVIYKPDYTVSYKGSDLTPAALDQQFYVELNNMLTPQVPACIVWAYNEKHFLPSKVEVAPFLEQPSSCAPLEQMFALAKIKNIKATYTSAQGRGTNAVRNLLDRVAEASTNHINEIWKECKGLTIKLEPNAEHIDTSILDFANRYDFSSRSDGFKRFVSFLLVISAKARSHSLSNTLLLIDEPEIGLHPSGVKYLRNELLRIAENNFVIISTHSIFMIDRDNLERHLRVQKQNETTTVLAVNQSNFRDEEVVYNALGYTIFESLEERNLVFEGWRDKQLFRTALTELPQGHEELKAKFEKIGLCHLQGVKDASRVYPMLDLAARRYIIVSDDDKPAREAQGRFDGEGKWIRYGEIVGDSRVVTSEDFLESSVFDEVIEDLRNRYISLGTIDLNSGTAGKAATLKVWFKAAGIEGDDQRILLDEVKERIFKKLTARDIKPVYYEFLEGLASTL